MPVRNEGANIPIMLKILSALIEVPHEILIVHDNPDDNTIPVVRRMQSSHTNVKLVNNTAGPGVANAIKTGVAAATGQYVLVFAVDEAGPVFAIDEMLSLLDNGCDLISCTRYAYGGRRLGGSFIGGVLSRIANKLFHIITGSPFTDFTTGIKMFRKSAFEEIILEAKPAGWAVAFELAIKAQLKGLRLGEVPIISIDRLYGGESTFSLGPWFIEYLKWFLWGAIRLLRHNKTAKNKIQIKIPSNIASNYQSHKVR